ncbi:hypothetical protein EUTSA_v10003403mg [Eutrema salsugineum]|uniref:F-box domain-containing protein n=1 Tax=Eutrema salsugineum TaxID=72664 RepID=V4LQJ0_EUTSA|nr:putative F-box protein At3g17480 [Eutrema salsugineum]ESQ44757.1 hypothetical protein EUTSA_v10003403mg [Eutrema salsugineum]
MKRLRSLSMSDLPWDLIEEILSKVPAIFLKRLRSTCKQWNMLFSDQVFTRTHFDIAAKQYLVLMLIDFKVYFLSVNLRGLHDNIDPSIELKGEVSLTNHHYHSNQFEISEVFDHCNGLLLCSLCTNMSTRLVVWNPCTGQTKWIQTKCVDNRYEESYALGYENNKSCHNYKILRFLEFYDTSESELEIYEFSSNSWRVLDSLTPDFAIQLQGVSLKGKTYWVAADKGNQFLGNKFLISFDFTTETFGPHMCLPHGDFYALSLVREERHSVLSQDEEASTIASTIEIWISNNITESKAISWSRFLKVKLNTHQFWNRDISFFIDEENKVAVCFEEIFQEESDNNNNIVYIIGEDIFREVNLGDSDAERWSSRMFSYIPSLVQI